MNFKKIASLLLLMLALSAVGAQADNQEKAAAGPAFSSSDQLPGGLQPSHYPPYYVSPN